MVSLRKRLLDFGRAKPQRSGRRKSIDRSVEKLEGRAMMTTYTMPLVNQTGLDPTKFAIYALGYSTQNKLFLQSDGTFGNIAPGSGNITSYKVGSGSGQLSTITWTDSQQIIGAIVDFFIVPSSGGSFPVPYLPYTNGGTDVVQPTNPPFFQLPNGQGAFVNQTVEITQPYNPSTPSVHTLPTIDVSEVDGFAVPINVTLNGGAQVGQPTYTSGQTPVINRASILQAYSDFVSAKVPSGLQATYSALIASSSTVDNQAFAIVNPGVFLTNGGQSGSLLNSTFDTALTTMFNGASSRKVGMFGVDSNYYQGTPLALSGGTIHVLDFKGYTDASCTTPNGNEFYIYSPLTPDTLAPNQGETSGAMVFSQNCVFNDASTNVLIADNGTGTAVVENLELQISSALNRGVALQGGTDGLNADNSTYWNTESNWYPASQNFNYFAWFMHTATVHDSTHNTNVNIFVPPSPSANDNQGNLMGQAYGFAFDESPDFVANPPNVPSKFDTVPTGTTTMTVTFTPWTSQSPGPGPGPGPASGKYFAVGSGWRMPAKVDVYQAGQSGGAELVKTLKPFGNFRGGVRVATGDVNGDGTDDIIAAEGPSGKLLVKVFDGSTFDLINSFEAFPQRAAKSKHIGVFVASGDVNNDGYSDIVVGADAGWTSDVRVYSGKDGSLLTEFQAFTGSISAGGARVAAGDINKDGFSEIVVGSGRGSTVSVFDGHTYAQTLSFNPYQGTSNRLGVFVALGDVEGDGVLDIVTGTGGSTPAKARVSDATNGQMIDEIFSNQKHYESVILGLFDWDDNGKDDVMTALGPGMPGHVDVWQHNTNWSRVGSLPVTKDQCGIWLS